MLSKARKHLTIIALSFLFLIGWVSYDWLNFIRRPIIALDKQPVDYVFEAGSSIFVLAHDFKKLGLLDRPIYLIALAKLTRLAPQLKAGEYRFMPGVKPLQLLDQIAKGRVLSHQLTIVEGWTFAKMLEAIQKEPRIKQTLSNVPAETIMAKLGSSILSPEGLFFPDSYRYTRGTADLAILQAAYQALQKHLEIEWENRAQGLPYQSPYQALIVASLVEKETSLTMERPLVAGVIVNRLRKNMLLQIDPTIIYGIGENYKGKLHSADLKKDTPYNTYIHLGLPPTPIALVSAASLHAALHPYEGNYLYFVAKGGDGSHQFSATLDEHKKAVKNYIHNKRALAKKAVKAVLPVDKAQPLCGSNIMNAPCKAQPSKSNSLDDITNFEVVKK